MFIKELINNLKVKSIEVVRSSIRSIIYFKNENYENEKNKLKLFTLYNEYFPFWKFI